MKNWPAADLNFAAQSLDPLTSDMAWAVIRKRWPTTDMFLLALKGHDTSNVVDIAHERKKK